MSSNETQQQGQQPQDLQVPQQGLQVTQLQGQQQLLQQQVPQVVQQPQHPPPQPQQGPPIYTIYSGGPQGSINYGFQTSHPLAPPPKYEDVINGNYLNPNYKLDPPPTDAQINYANVHPQYSHYHTVTTSEYENYKFKRCSSSFVLLVVLILFGLYMWRNLNY